MRIKDKIWENRYRRRKVYHEWYFDCLERDNYKCVDCGLDGYEKAINILVHHTDESRKRKKLNNKLSNLTTLCKPCHARRHGQTSYKHDIVEMRSNGLTYQDIGDKFGITRQRVHQIIKGYWQQKPSGNKIFINPRFTT